MHPPRSLRSQLARLGAAIFLAALVAPVSASAMDANCRSGIKERMNLAIGLYRIEIAASHMIGQVTAARNNPGRQQQLDNARDGLNELKVRLRSRADELLADADAKGRCAADSTILTPIHTAISGYFRVVDARWRFMENRLVLLKKLQPGQDLPGDPGETDLWMQEPLTRYEVWRTLARAAPPHGEMASALYVIGVLTRFE